MKRTPTNRDFVISHLHWNGANKDVLSGKEQETIRLNLADGMGHIPNMDISVHDKLDTAWDWSHIRDSSEAAFTKMAEVIRVIADAKT